MFNFGIEHEVSFINKMGKFADFNQTNFADFNQIVERLPTYSSDYPQLRIGDAGIKKKRWYIEGFERFSESANVTDCIPKGIEIRTTIHADIKTAIQELSESFDLLCEVAAQFGFSPVLVSFNPFHSSFQPQQPLNNYETQRRRASPEKQTAYIPMLTYGPDLNISVAQLPYEDVIDIGRKLTYYSPYIIPFSYSSPFYEGDLWSGLSVRTFVRTGKRPATMVFVEKNEQIIKSVPSLTKIARIPAEVGRIEFKAFDSCDDFSIYAGLLALLKGLILDQSLLGRAVVPDAALHQLSAQRGFHDEDIFNHSQAILQAAENALAQDLDIQYLQPLKMMLQTKVTKADWMIQEFKQMGSIEKVLKQTYGNKNS